MAKEKFKNGFHFNKAAIYKIVVHGEVDPAWLTRSWGLQVSIEKISGGKSISTIVGQINDQSALSGILTILNDMHMTVIAVNMLSEIEG